MHLQINRIKRNIFLLLMLLITVSAQAFTVVIDAGHGGRDPGALGARLQEKNLNLEISKRVAAKIKQQYPDVKVLLTRSTDEFLTLQDRANFVNKNHADLFICIHTNAAENKKINGLETYVLGLNKMESNLDVAMRENAVMMLEDDYKTTYKGFDPNSVESYIMFEFMQDQYIDKSLAFASLVQKEMVAQTGRIDRGVHQAAFWVLHQSACPSVLVEMGFLSHAAEEKYLASAAGKEALTNAIFNAFVQYKKSVDKSNPTAATSTPEVTTPVESNIQEQQAEIQQPVFRIQIFSVKAPLKKNDPSFKGLKGCQYTQDGAFYKYTYGEETSYQKILQVKQELSKKFKDCFVVAFLGDEQIYVKDARKMTNQ